MVTGVLCETPCNIRVDLVFFFPILGLATFCAYQSYIGRPGQHKVIGTVLGAVALLVVGLVAEGHGYRTLASVVVVVGALAIGVYAIKSSQFVSFLAGFMPYQFRRRRKPKPAS